MIENKFANKQESNIENKQHPNLLDLGLSSTLGILTPDTNYREEQQQVPVKKRRNPNGE